MAVRIREDGRILCAAMHPEEAGDTYLHDGVHYRLSVELRVLVTEPMHCDGGRGGHAKHGEWWWANAVPFDVEIERHEKAPDLPARITSSDLLLAESLLAHLSQGLAIDYQIRGNEFTGEMMTLHGRDRAALMIVRNLLLNHAEIIGRSY